MVTILRDISPKIQEAELDKRAMSVFMKVLEILGGPRRLFEYRNLTWLPSIMEASYVVVLASDYSKSRDEIASKLGLSKTTVTNILRANPDEAESVIREGFLAGAKRPRHMAGALAKLAYRELKREAGNKDHGREMEQ